MVIVLLSSLTMGGGGGCYQETGEEARQADAVVTYKTCIPEVSCTNLRKVTCYSD
jgi:hypothetical protein